MKSRALRIALATLFVGVLGGAAYVSWSEIIEGKATASATRQFQDKARTVSRALLDIKSAQPGYVAAGQGDDFWIARVDASSRTAREGLTSLRSHALAARAQSEIDAAAAALDDFEQMDRRARDYVRNGQRLLASDLVFSDGIERIDAATAAVERAQAAVLAASDAELQQRERKQWMAAGGAAALSILTLGLLIPLPRETTAATAATTGLEPAMDLPIAPRATIAPSPVPAAVPAAPPAALSAAPSAAVDFSAVASLCSQLARVIDTRALPAALEHASKLLNASGIVIWVADPDGRELTPVIAHGYPQNVLVRMGTITRDAQNVTAAAFRTGVLQTVKADAVSQGAIAAPLLTPAGAVGVMAAEVLGEGERHEGTRAAAAIVAAQLATLIGPPARQGKAGAAGA
jgi:hypothetical protein